MPAICAADRVTQTELIDGIRDRGWTFEPWAGGLRVRRSWWIGGGAGGIIVRRPVDQHATAMDICETPFHAFESVCEALAHIGPPTVPDGDRSTVPDAARADSGTVQAAPDPDSVVDQLAARGIAAEVGIGDEVAVEVPGCDELASLDLGAGVLHHAGETVAVDGDPVEAVGRLLAAAEAGRLEPQTVPVEPGSTGTDPVRVAALYVDPRGVYAGRAGVDLWGEARDARTYAGPLPIVAHPPCGRWGRLWKQAGAAYPGEGDDCWAAAVAAVLRWGGVIEHPRDSIAVRQTFGRIPPTGAWAQTLDGWWGTVVYQGAYGHAAPKQTALLWYSPTGLTPPALDWSPVDPGGRVMNLCSRLRKATPPAFADVLIDLALATRDPDADAPPEADPLQRGHWRRRWAAYVPSERPATTVRRATAAARRAAVSVHVPPAHAPLFEYQTRSRAPDSLASTVRVLATGQVAHEGYWTARSHGRPRDPVPSRFIAWLWLLGCGTRVMAAVTGVSKSAIGRRLVELTADAPPPGHVTEPAAAILAEWDRPATSPADIRDGGR